MPNQRITSSNKIPAHLAEAQSPLNAVIEQVGDEWDTFYSNPEAYVKKNVEESNRKRTETFDRILSGKGGITEDDMMSALDSISFGGAGAIRGIKRFGTLYHGTGDVAKKEQILQRGFSRGASAELGLEGTSLSRDPMVSFRGFAGQDPNNMLVVKPDVPLEEVRNLRPSEYIQGEKFLGDTTEVYNKPNEFFMEAETFLKRGEFGGPPVDMRNITPKEELDLLIDAKRVDNLSELRRTLEDDIRTGSSKDVLALKYKNILGSLRSLRGNRGTWSQYADLILRDPSSTSLVKGDLLRKMTEHTKNRDQLYKDYLVLSDQIKGGKEIPKKVLDTFDEHTKAVQKSRESVISDLEQQFGYHQKPPLSTSQSKNIRRTTEAQRDPLAKKGPVLKTIDEVLASDN